MVPILPVLGFVITAVALLSEIVSTATSDWHTVQDNGLKYTYGLWKHCVTSVSRTRTQNCSYEPLDWTATAAQIKVAQFCMVLACIISVTSILMMIFIFSGRLTAGCLKCVSILMSMSSISALFGSGWYAARTSKHAEDTKADIIWGYSIVIGWMSIALALLAAGLFCGASIQYTAFQRQRNIGVARTNQRRYTINAFDDSPC